jgi:hypothetical protein
MGYIPIRRLDNRSSLYGEPRLSDAQVQCLRAIQAGAFKWDNHATATVRALAHRLQLIDIDHDLYPAVTETGRKVLAAIDAASAPGLERSTS